MKLRIKFSKTGTMKYIGHLDVMRYFQKALRRAQFDTTLSGGFSPHMIMSFAAPLGVGITSEGEYFDLEVASAASSEEMKQRLNAVMADGITVLSVLQIPDDKKYGGMRLLAAADYLVSLKQLTDSGNDTELAEAAAEAQKLIPAFLEQKEILLEKKTKKGSKVMDIRPLIYRLEPRGDAFYLFVSQGSVNNLRPEYVIEKLFAFAGREIPAQNLKIHRLDLFAEAEGSGQNRFRSLESYGEACP
ncbi:MAG: DUF2344 domain-containing protein [Eubacterium sp.]|nr:DUF2344 domain-containing protein [Eubacterium sp.]